MPSMETLAAAYAGLGPADLDRLAALTADWQIVADLSFADLVLWVPDRDGSGYHALAQMRPTTGPTAYVDDIVGEYLPRGRLPLVDSAADHGRIAREGDPEWRDQVPVGVEAVPVPREGRVIAVVARNTSLQGVRTPSRLELAYLQTAAEITELLADGLFPAPGPRPDLVHSPRVGDGLIRIGGSGQVTYASPNALSVYRRLGLRGDLTGLSLATVTRGLLPATRRTDEETFSAVLGGRVSRGTELGNGSVTVVLRAIPLHRPGEPGGGLILLRDVTELRRREHELVTKDATIREIHHRVKNNLQSVAALLRLQARRMDNPEAAQALEEAVRRVGSIAVVHETLSTFSGGDSGEAVDFDEVAARLARAVAEVGAGGVRDGSGSGRFGQLDAEVATPLAMVLTELLQNAQEHGFPEGRDGPIELGGGREGEMLTCWVRDLGVGVPEGFDPEAAAGLGLSIVRTLVDGLGGTLTVVPGEDGGTVATVRVPI